MTRIPNRYFLRRFGVACLIGFVIGLGFLSKYTMLMAFLLLPGFVILQWCLQTSNGVSDAEHNSMPSHWGIYGQRNSLTGQAKLRFQECMLITVISLSIISGWVWQLNEMGLLERQSTQILDYMRITVEPTNGASGQLEEFCGGKTNCAPMTGSSLHYDFFHPWYVDYLFSTIVIRLPQAIGLYNLPLITLGLWYMWRKWRRQPANPIILMWLVVVFVPVFLTLPVPRYFMPAYPALAILMACGLDSVMPKASLRIVLLSLALGISSVALYTSTEALKNAREILLSTNAAVDLQF